jgi:hypothetical protein
MSKIVTLTLTEKQYNLLKLQVFIGDYVKDSIEEKSKKETMQQLDLYQLLDKAAYEAKLKGSGVHEGFYYHGKELEDQMMDIMDNYDDYVESGEKDEEMEEILLHLEELEKQSKKK